MTKNPFANALLASGYISFIALFLQNGQHLFGPVDTVLAPIVMISLFTLSAAVMGYVFCYQPLRFFLEGQKEAAVSLFLRTVGVFALIILALLIAVYLIG